MTIIKKLSEKYGFGFDIWGFLLFLVIMIPNFIWFAVPAPNDILREFPDTWIDIVSSVFQVLMAAALCAVKNKECKRIKLTSWTTASLVCCLLYFVSWVFYYTGTVNDLVIFGLTLPPCFAFLAYETDRKNLIAVIPTVIFSFCHLMRLFIIPV